MYNGYTNTSPGVYHSGEICQLDVQTIKELSAGKPVVIFNMQAEQQDKLFIPEGWSILWWNREDFPSESPEQVADIFMRIGRVADMFQKAGYVIWFHCVAGCNRSTMANVAYRVTSFGETGLEAFLKIKELRGCVNLVPEHTLALEYMR